MFNFSFYLNVFINLYGFYFGQLLLKIPNFQHICVESGCLFLNAAFDIDIDVIFVILVKLNSLPNDKILHWSKLKAFADNNLNVAKLTVSVFDRAENIVGKEENADCQHFLIFPQCFRKASCTGLLKVGAVLKSSSQWQLKEFWKLKYSGHELFICKILLIAIDWNF